MELFCKEEVCQIVKEMIKNFIRWDGYIQCEEQVEEVWKNFIDEPANLRIRFKRLIDVEEVNVKDLDVNRTV